MFHAALWKLIRLQWRGGFRQFRRSLRTFRGQFHLGFMLLGFVYFVVMMYFAGRIGSRSPQLGLFAEDVVGDLVAFGLFVYTAWTVVFSTGEATVYFTASEVAFLFPAPFTRKQLLSYKLFKSFLGIVAMSLFMSLALAARVRMWGSVVFGLVLMFSFLQLLAMDVAFLRQVLQEKVHVWLRRACGYGLSALVLVALIQTVQQAPDASVVALASGFRQSTAAAWLLAPFRVFASTLLATDFATFLIPASIALMIDAALLTLAYRLDALSLEAALAVSEKLTARLKLMQTKGVWNVLGSPSSKIVRRRLPHPPFWGGVGPILWQKMMTTFRASLKLLWLLAGAVLFAYGMIYFINGSSPNRPGNPFAGVAVMAYFSLLISLTQQNEIERVGYLKSLPIPSVSIVLGELLGFVVLLSAVQTAFFLALCCAFPQWAMWLAGIAVLTLPLNFMLFATDKLVFYLYPTRLAKGAPGDFQNSGRQMVFMSLKMAILGVGFAFAGAAAIPGAALFQSPLAALVPASLVLVLECVALVPLLTMAFNRFDPSQDMPA
ncbi:MAG: putative ABC exporter domain-containing protein [Planctomycetota bacterium]